MFSLCDGITFLARHARVMQGKVEGIPYEQESPQREDGEDRDRTD